MAEEVIQLDINQLQPNPLQPRGAITPESLVDLVDSIREHGILEPLVIAKTPAGFQIIAGERRWRASKLAGLTHVPVIIRETTPKGMLEMAIVENVQRVDLNAVRIGKSVAYVSNSLRLLTLPDALKDGLLSGLISEGHARALAAIDDVDLMVEAYKIILRESGSVRRAEELARRMKAEHNEKRKVNLPKMHIVSDEIDKMKSDFEHALGEKHQVKLARSRRETRLTFVLKGSLDETENTLQLIYKAIASN